MKSWFIFLSITKNIFINLGIIIILFFLPMDILFRLSSWTLFMTTWDIVEMISMMVLLLLTVIFIIALLFSLLTTSVIINLPFHDHEQSQKKVTTIVFISILIILSLFLLKMLKLWLEQISGIMITVGQAKPLIALVVLLIWIGFIWRKGLLNFGTLLHAKLARGNKLLLIVVVVSVIIVTINGIQLHDYNGIKSNPLPVVRSGMPNVILLSIDTLTAEDMSLYRLSFAHYSSIK